MNHFQITLAFLALVLGISILIVMGRITLREAQKRKEIERHCSLLAQNLLDVDRRVKQTETKLEKFDPTRTSMQIVRSAQRPDRESTQTHDERKSGDSSWQGGAVEHEVPPPIVEDLRERDVDIVTNASPDPPEEYSEQLITRLFQDWCRSGETPAPPSTVEFRMAEFVRSDAPMVQGARPVYIVRDTEKTAEFGRFSAQRSDEGLVVPNPRAHYTPVVAYLYDGLSSEQYENPFALAAITPVRVQRREGAEWEVVL